MAFGWYVMSLLTNNNSTKTNLNTDYLLGTWEFEGIELMFLENNKAQFYIVEDSLVGKYSYDLKANYLFMVNNIDTIYWRVLLLEKDKLIIEDEEGACTWRKLKWSKN